MKKLFKKMIVLAIAVTVGLIAGCGDGGGGTVPPGGSVFKLTLSAANAPAGSMIGGIQGTLALPAGSSIRTEGTSELVPGELFAASGNADSSLVSAKFTAATGTLNFALIKAAGFSGGDFATLQIDVNPGVSVTAADFTLSGSKVIDTEGNNMAIAVTLK